MDIVDLRKTVGTKGQDGTKEITAGGKRRIAGINSCLGKELELQILPTPRIWWHVRVTVQPGLSNEEP
jgi:hypothetical protein